MPDLKAIEAKVEDSQRRRDRGQSWHDCVDECADLLAYVRELREALGAFLEQEELTNGLDCDMRIAGGELECETHEYLVPFNTPCPVARARRLTSE